jgi:putative membrane protein
VHTGHRYSIPQLLSWSRREALWPAAWSTAVTLFYVIFDATWMQLPWLPMSLIGIAVAFYLGFKNNASYERLWEARKIWGAIVNASRSWAFSARDLIHSGYPGPHEAIDAEALKQHHSVLVHRHAAWMDALRFQLRKVKSWEHDAELHNTLRYEMGVPEFHESLAEQLGRNLSEEEVTEAMAQLNPAARLLANQSRHLATLRAQGLLDAFSHMHLQGLLTELMTQQGKAERIKNFPFPRQYATVNTMFAWLFTLLLPFGMLNEFSAELGHGWIWMVVPFSTLVSWVFLTADRIGDWSENPFEGLANDVPISTMARGIERDILQMIDETELPPARKPTGMIQY